MAKIWSAVAVVGVELALLVWLVGSHVVDWIGSLTTLGQ